MNMLRKLRIALGALCLLGITLLFLDLSGALHHWLGWLARIQFLPAVFALNLGVIVALVLVTLIFGRIYCSVICPLGVFQDGVSNLSSRRKGKKARFGYSKEKKWLRYGVWVIFVVALVAGVGSLVALLAPYSAYGRIVQSLIAPLVGWGNNLLAAIAERYDSYAFATREVWMKSLPTLIIAAVTLIAVVILAWKNGRTYCNTICPVGTTLSFFSRFAMFRPMIDKSKCRNCRACEKKCKAACIDVDNHKIDYSRCVDCFDCLENCKFGALKYRFAWKAGSGENAAVTGSKTPQNAAVTRKDTGDGVNNATKRDRHEQNPEETGNGRRAFLIGGAAVIGGTMLAELQAMAQSGAKSADKADRVSADDTTGIKDKKRDGGFAEIIPKKAPARTVPVTPFGSESVNKFYDRCTACQLCVATCPNNVLRPTSTLDHLMQPQMSFERGYCRPECVKCSEVCPAGAILKITPEEKTSWKVGTASVDLDLCVVNRDEVSCGNCARHCPVGAIRMVKKNPDDEKSLRIPTVNEEKCIGCGACENLCPSRPISAITVNGCQVHHKI